MFLKADSQITTVKILYRIVAPWRRFLSRTNRRLRRRRRWAHREMDVGRSTH